MCAHFLVVKLFGIRPDFSRRFNLKIQLSATLYKYKMQAHRYSHYYHFYNWNMSAKAEKVEVHRIYSSCKPYQVLMKGVDTLAPTIHGESSQQEVLTSRSFETCTQRTSKSFDLPRELFLLQLFLDISNPMSTTCILYKAITFQINFWLLCFSRST